MDWEEAIEEAREELGYSNDEFIEDWSEVVETAREIQDFAWEEEYGNFCVDAHNLHQHYLKSEGWKKLRLEILKRDNFICKDCGVGATEVHHLNYDFLHTSEEKNYCVSLCGDCHKKRHKIK